jgi:hypothetical protein
MPLADTPPIPLRERVVHCSKCGDPLSRPNPNSTSPPFCMKLSCRREYAKWRYRNIPEDRRRRLDGNTRRRRRIG